MDEKQSKIHFYELPETVSIWLCNFSILKSEDIFKDTWAVYSENEILHSDTAHKALPVFTKNRYIVRISPELLKALEEHMFDKHADEAIEAEIWLKAEAQGLEKGREQGLEEGLEKGRDKEREKTALDMLADNEPIEKIVKYSHLSTEKVLELKASRAKQKL